MKKHAREIFHLFGGGGGKRSFFVCACFLMSGTKNWSLALFLVVLQEREREKVGTQKTLKSLEERKSVD
jgi:hypothetical protein